MPAPAVLENLDRERKDLPNEEAIYLVAPDENVSTTTCSEVLYVHTYVLYIVCVCVCVCVRVCMRACVIVLPAALRAECQQNHW